MRRRGDRRTRTRWREQNARCDGKPLDQTRQDGVNKEGNVGFPLPRTSGGDPGREEVVSVQKSVLVKTHEQDRPGMLYEEGVGFTPRRSISGYGKQSIPGSL